MHDILARLPPRPREQSESGCGSGWAHGADAARSDEALARKISSKIESRHQLRIWTAARARCSIVAEQRDCLAQIARLVLDGLAPSCKLSAGARRSARRDNAHVRDAPQSACVDTIVKALNFSVHK